MWEKLQEILEKIVSSICPLIMVIQETLQQEVQFLEQIVLIYLRDLNILLVLTLSSQD